MAKIELKAVRKIFDSTEILKGIDLAIEDGEFIALIGPSGCGKSTLLRVIAGLEPQTSGEVRIGDVSVDGVRPSARNLAMVFQSYALYPHLSVFDNIAVPLRMRRHSALARTPLLGRLLPGRASTERGIREEVERVAAQLELSSLLRRKPGQLSGGQRQRVAVGRAIVRQPLGFLFDEPLSNLDAKLRVHMRTELAQLHRQLKATFVYVTHDQAEAMTMSSRIAVMIEGHIVQVGTPAEVYENPQDIRVAEFVGSPKINAMPGVIREDGGLEVLGRPLGLSTSARGGPLLDLRTSRAHGTRHGPRRHFRHRGASRAPRLGGIRSRQGRSRSIFRCSRASTPTGSCPRSEAASTSPIPANAARVFDAAGKRIEVAAPVRSGRVLEQAVG